MSIIKPSEKHVAERVVFARPINEIARPIVAIVASASDKLVAAATSYDIITATGSRANVYLYSTSKAESVVPADVRFALDGTINAAHAAEADELLTRIDTNASLAVIGYGMSLASTTQILLERWLLHSTVPVVLFGQVAHIVGYDNGVAARDDVLLCLSSVEFVQLCNKLAIPLKISSGRGVYTYSDAFARLHVRSPKLNVMIYDANYYYMFDAVLAEEMVLARTFGKADAAVVYSGLVASLASFPLRSFKNLGDQMYAAAYIAEQAYVASIRDKHKYPEAIAREYKLLQG